MRRFLFICLSLVAKLLDIVLGEIVKVHTSWIEHKMINKKLKDYRHSYNLLALLPDVGH